jgi:hypothetical protein
MKQVSIHLRHLTELETDICDVTRVYVEAVVRGDRDTCMRMWGIALPREYLYLALLLGRDHQ